MPRPRLRPLPDYEDLPPWAHDQDSVRVRLVNAAWNQLLRRDLAEVGFRELADEVGVTPAAVYHWFPTATDLAATLATAACAALRVDLAAATNRHGGSVAAFATFFDFARRRPHHFALLASPRFNRAPQVARERKKLGADLDVMLANALGRQPSDAQRRTLRVILHGASSMIAAGALGPTEAMRVLTDALGPFRKR